MYIRDGIAYADDPTPILGVKGVRALEERCLKVRFTDGVIKIYDCADLLEYPVFQPLKDDAVFRGAYVDYGTVVWNGGTIDIAPEELYENGVTVHEW